MTAIRLACLLTCVAWLTGCRGGGGESTTGEVSGAVSLEGVASSSTILIFSSAELRVSKTARIDEQGAYSIKGLPPGAYRVHFAAAPQNFATGQEAPPPQAAIPSEYLSANTSGIEANVAAGKNRFDISLP